MTSTSPVSNSFHADTRIAIISTQWNPTVVDSLVEAAMATCTERGVSEEGIDHFVVPGAFEIPTLLGHLVDEDEDYDGVITLGAVIKGDTAHFEYVAGECARGVAELSRQSGIPVGFGVLATYDLEQALERAGPNAENKGVEAANAVLDMIELIASLQDD
nr:6,7-dimethyl-8-ribityllumazine synthase [Oceanococcus sp. HetDA_MAG_MS8]